MAAPASTVPVVASGSSPTTYGADVLEYVGESVVGAATLLQHMPVVGDACATYLAFQQLAGTAKSNKEALSTLRKLCDVVIKGVLISRANRPGLPEEGFVELKEHVDKAEKVAKLCNGVGVKGRLKRFVLARKISNDIAAIRSNVLAFCSVNNLVLADGTYVSTLVLLWRFSPCVSPLSTLISLSLSLCCVFYHIAPHGKCTRENWVACVRIVLGRGLHSGGNTSHSELQGRWSPALVGLAVEPRMRCARAFATVPALPCEQAKVDKLATDLAGELEAMKQLTVTQEEYEVMEKEVASMTKELEVMGIEVEAKDNLEVSISVSRKIPH